MQKYQALLISLGKLVKAKRSQTMDQQELGARVGLGRNTISSIENGKAVSSASLFSVLAHLGLLEDIQYSVDQALKHFGSSLQRKARKLPEQLDNNF
jgi:transcriptional regulator with XRE-family HTH domain